MIDAPGAHVHVSGIAGLIHATRQAAAVVGGDSGPLHLAAAIGKPGVAIFGPTDPARHGPYGGSRSKSYDRPTRRPPTSELPKLLLACDPSQWITC